jgi:hypothetical protein
MKRHLVLILGIVLCSTAYSQNIIPKIGGSLANVSLGDDLKDDGADYKNKAGLVVGVAFEFPIEKGFSIQPELLFHQKGYREEANDGGVNAKLKVALNYLELPVMFKYNFSNFYINAGPSIAYGVGGKYEIEASSQSQSFSESGKVKFGKASDNVNDDKFYVDNAVDFGLQFGGGVKIAKLIVVDLRYGLGLSNSTDKDSDSGISDNKSKNRSFQITVGFPIKIGAK